MITCCQAQEEHCCEIMQRAYMVLLDVWIRFVAKKFAFPFTAHLPETVKQVTTGKTLDTSEVS